MLLRTVSLHLKNTLDSADISCSRLRWWNIIYIHIMISRFSDPSALWMSIRLSQFHLMSWRMHVAPKTLQLEVDGTAQHWYTVYMEPDSHPFTNRYFNWMITDLHMRMVGNHHGHPFTTALPLISINSTSKTSYSCLQKKWYTMFSRWLFRVSGNYISGNMGSSKKSCFWCFLGTWISSPGGVLMQIL